MTTNSKTPQFQNRTVSLQTDHVLTAQIPQDQTLLLDRPAVNQALELGGQPAALIFIAVGAATGLVAGVAIYNKVFMNSLANLLKVVKENPAPNQNQSEILTHRETVKESSKETSRETVKVTELGK